MRFKFKRRWTVAGASLLVICLGMVSVSGQEGYPGRSEDKIVVQKEGDKVFIRSWFSPSQDVMITMNKGNNRQINYYTAALIPAAAPTLQTNFSSDKIFHYCHDDTSPLKIISTYIGANHGCSDARELLIPGHGLTEKDIGTAWADSRGEVYYPIKIIDDSKIWVLGENKGKNGIWQFNRLIAAGDFSRQSDDRKLKIEKVVLAQIHPAARIKKQEYLIDGKTTLPDGKPVICDYLDIVEEYDIVAPDSLLDTIKKQPGREPDWLAPGIDALLTYKTTYQFQPRGACFIDNHIIPNRDFLTSHFSPVMTMQLNRLNNYQTHEYYIPKTKPFENEGTKYDFNSIQDFTVPIKLSLSFSAANNNIDPADPPDRFIQFLGKSENGKKARKAGFAIGIANDTGLGRAEDRLKNVDEMLFIQKTFKTYPKVLDAKAGVLKAGVDLHSRGYRQYFNPEAFQKPTCVYWHRRGDTVWLYADYHQPVVRDIIKMPDYLIGKTISVAEQSPSVTLLTKDQVTKEGIAVSVDGTQGYLVLKLK